MMVGVMQVRLSYPGAATVAGLVQLEGVKAASMLSYIFILLLSHPGI